GPTGQSGPASSVAINLTGPTGSTGISATSLLGRTGATGPAMNDNICSVAPPPRRHTVFLRLASRYVVPAIGKPDGLRLAFDIETDGLLEAATRIHCLIVEDLDSNRVDEFGPDQIDAGLIRLSEARVLVGHNIVGYDLQVLRRLHGWNPAPDCIVVDTLIVSRLVLANI